MSSVRFDYDTSYYPSAPVAEIEVDAFDEELGKRTLRALIDSGADATMIPLHILESIGAAYKETM